MLNYSLAWRAAVPVPVHEIWFAQIGDRLDLGRAWMPGALRLFAAQRHCDGLIGRWRHRLSLLTELIELEPLKARLSRGLRYDIRRAHERDRIRILDPLPLARFLDFAATADPRNPNRPHRPRLEHLEALGRLTIRAAEADDRLLLCAHAYVDDGRRVRLMHSYSRRPRAAAGKPGESADDASRTDHAELAARVGRANKALHWADLERFRARGLNIYDWGGISGQAHSGVDQFKQQFLGTSISEWAFDGAMRPRRGPLRF